MSTSTSNPAATQPVKADRCPICGAPNECAVSACGAFDVDCWCAKVRIGDDVLARVPEAQKGLACVCRRCAMNGSVTGDTTQCCPSPAAASYGLGEGDALPPLPAIRLGLWRHYKGLDYEVLGVVRHSETLEPLVLYRPLYNDSGTWVRPYAMFLETVEVDGRRQSRFEFLAAKAEYPADAPTGDEAASPQPPGSWPEGWVIDIQDQHAAAGLAVVDEGLDAYNTSVAALHEVRPLACLAQDPEHRVMGGAMGRLWADCAELQQLWVHETLRSQGLGRRLLMAFEEAARDRGTTKLFLETFSFQAPTFYERCGYLRESTNPHYPHGISKHRYFKRLIR